MNLQFSPPLTDDLRDIGRSGNDFLHRLFPDRKNRFGFKVSQKKPIANFLFGQFLCHERAALEIVAEYFSAL
ncbi:MAG TPA: hypothetical protein VFR76_10515 [Verrucomicrobiae bacterium]|nr:hypothetical protein [Verrucomicrobiae bacterium]